MRPVCRQLAVSCPLFAREDAGGPRRLISPVTRWCREARREAAPDAKRSTRATPAPRVHPLAGRVHYFLVLRCLYFAAHVQVVPTVLDLQDVNVRAPPFPRHVPAQRRQRATSPSRAVCVPVRR